MTSVQQWPAGAYADSVLRPLWLDTSARPAPRPPVTGSCEVDLLVVGGGFTGLWTALRALERDPSTRVLLVEGDRIAEHATGRNGGFCEASLTHGEANGRERWPEEYEQIHALGLRNLDEIGETVDRYGIDCGFVRGGALWVATRSHEVAAAVADPGFLDSGQVRAMLDSPTYLGGGYDEEGCALVDPARLAWGLADAAEGLGARIAEGTRVEALREVRLGDGTRGVEARVRASVGDETVSGENTVRSVVRARSVVLATNVFQHLVPRLRWSVVPVYDYVLATEPLTDAQLAALRWDPSIGVADSGNLFHYYRLTPDRRILWGGYEPVYHYGRAVGPELEDRPATFDLLARHFAETFPQLRGLRFTHRWSGAIDTSSRFCAFYGTAHRGRTAYALGFTGLGVGASRFAADVLLDLLTGADTERTRLRMVRERPLPFPPEPFAWAGIGVTTWAMARQDRTGRRNLWLRTLDRLGLGFDF